MTQFQLSKAHPHAGFSGGHTPNERRSLNGRERWQR
jgi:hypothetical protein